VNTAVDAVWKSETDRKLGHHEAELQSHAARLDSTVSKSTFEAKHQAHEDMLKKTVTLDAFTPLQRIVYGATGIILIGAMALVGRIVTAGHFTW
jgi:hypothetical protein